MSETTHDNPHNECDASDVDVKNCNNLDGKYWDVENCTCKCHMDESSCTQHNLVLNYNTCECECGSPSMYECNSGQIVHDLEGHCVCGCPEGEKELCNADFVEWNQDHCLCDCIQSPNCTGDRRLKLKDGECKCECDANVMHCYSPFEVTTTDSGCICQCNQEQKDNCDNDGRITTYWNSHTCSCDVCYYLVDLLKEGSTSIPCPNPEDFEGSTECEIRSSESSAKERRKILGITYDTNPNVSSAETANSVQQSNTTLTTGGSLTIEPTTQDFPVGSQVVPIKNEESTTHTISDPHIKTFFDKKYEM